MFIKPNEYHKTVATIDWNKLYGQGYRIAVFDIDNTLDLPDKETKITKALIEYIATVEQAGFEVMFMSNNHDERVQSFTKHFPNRYQANSHKPFPPGYKRFLKSYDLHSTVFVGDKIVTDIIGGNWCKGYTILVDPLTTQKKYWYTKFMNGCESIFRTITGFKKGDYYE